MHVWCGLRPRHGREQSVDASERAAVVAFLRERHAATQEWDGRVNAVSHTYNHAANEIERGEHRREEEK